MADSIAGAAGWRQALTPLAGRSALTHWAVLVAATIVVLALQAPWGTSRLPFLRRACEFSGAVLLWEACVLFCLRMLRRRLAWARAATPLPLLTAVLLAAIPATAGILGVIRLAGDDIPSLPSLGMRSLLLGFVIAFAWRGLTLGRVHQAAPATPPARSEAARTVADPAADFLARHAPALAGRRLLALEAEDHYLRIHTDGGTALILMRLRDGIRMLGAGAGWQPHRSFWLAAGVEARVERNGQSFRLRLPTGLAVPVSRANAEAMRKAGYRAR
jgi:hypothetical protein